MAASDGAKIRHISEFGIVAQGVGMDPILEAGVLRRLVAGVPDGLGTDGAIRGMRAPAGE